MIGLLFQLRPLLSRHATHCRQGSYRLLATQAAFFGMHQAIIEPDDASDDEQNKEYQGKIPVHATTFYLSSTCKMAKNASWGISTLPTCFMRFLPAFCFSSNLRLREISPP